MSKSSNFYENLLSASADGSVDEAQTKLVERGRTIKDRNDKRDRILDYVEKFYYEVGIKKQSKDSDVWQVLVNDAQSAINLITDLVSAHDVKVIIPAYSEELEAKEEANDQERWLQAWIKMTETEEDVNFSAELAFDAMARGAVVMRCLMIDERIPDKKKKSEDKKDAGSKKTKKGKETSFLAEFPLLPEIRDYRYCYPVYKRTRVVEMFEAYQATAADVTIDWPELDVPSEWDDEDEVTVWEWWDDKRRAFWIEGTPYGNASSKDMVLGVLWLMPPTEHDYGCLPYSVRAIRPQSKKRNKPERMAPSLLADWAGTLQAMNLMESAKFTSVMTYINSAWVVHSNRTKGELDIKLSQGAINYLMPELDEKIESLVKADMPLDLQEVSQEWAERFQRASIPRAMYGESIGPQTAGYAISLLNEAGRRILIPITNAITKSMADICGIALSISEHHLGPTLKALGYDLQIFVTEEDVSKRLFRKGVDLDWESIGGLYMVETQMGDILPADDERAMNLAVAARQPNAGGMPLLSDETIRTEILKRNDNKQEVMRILKDRMLAEAATVVAEQTAIDGGLIPDPAEEEARAQEEAAAQQQAQMQQQEQMAMIQQMAMQGQQPQAPPVDPGLLDAIMQRLDGIEMAVSGGAVTTPPPIADTMAAQQAGALPPGPPMMPDQGGALPGPIQAMLEGAGAGPPVDPMGAPLPGGPEEELIP